MAKPDDRVAKRQRLVGPGEPAACPEALTGNRQGAGDGLELAKAVHVAAGVVPAESLETDQSALLANRGTILADHQAERGLESRRVEMVPQSTQVFAKLAAGRAHVVPPVSTHRQCQRCMPTGFWRGLEAGQSDKAGRVRHRSLYLSRNES